MADKFTTFFLFVEEAVVVSGSSYSSMYSYSSSVLKKFLNLSFILILHPPYEIRILRVLNRFGYVWHLLLWPHQSHYSFPLINRSKVHGKIVQLQFHHAVVLNDGRLDGFRLYLQYVEPSSLIQQYARFQMKLIP